MSCLDNIVTTGICPDDSESLSGYRLIDAAGISIRNLAAVANENYIQGIDLALSKKSLAITSVQNDFMANLQLNGVNKNSFNPTYESSIFYPSKVIDASVSERGVVLHKVGVRKSYLRSTKIKEIQVYPLDSGDAEIVIYNKGMRYAWPVSLTAGGVNVFDKDTLTDFDFEVLGEDAKVLISAPNIRLASAEITCMKGCHGKAPNECGWVDGYNGTSAVKSEGYGVNIVFYCHCDYDKILCDMSKSFVGNLIYLKWQILIFEEQFLSNRFNNWVIYNKDTISNTVLPDLKQQYNDRWSAMVAALPDMLNTYRDECLNCKGIRWVNNF